MTIPFNDLFDDLGRVFGLGNDINTAVGTTIEAAAQTYTSGLNTPTIRFESARDAGDRQAPSE